MARCWTCGSSVSGYHYRCSLCKDALREIESLHETVSEGFADLARIQEQGFNQLSDQLSEISTILEWGFGELSWQLQQQTDVLRSIDHTLKTPSETKANEWRLHAEELRRRGVLDESEEFFLKALNEYRLDYRIYIGLTETYLQMNKFEKAKIFLEKSLPHAPKKFQKTEDHKRLLDLTRDYLREGGITKAMFIRIQSEMGTPLNKAQDIVEQIINEGGKAELGMPFDWKSHSYRLIGHIHACNEDYIQAAVSLRSSIELSPGYAEGYYDYAQYCAQIGKKKDCLDSLGMAILFKPLYWYLAQKERNFDPVRSEVEKLLSSIITEASRRAKNAIAISESVLKEAIEAVSKARQALILSRDKAELKSNTIYENAEAKLKLAKDKVASGDYVAFLEAKPIANEAHALANDAVNTAIEERNHYRERYKIREGAGWPRPFSLIAVIIGFGIIGAIGGYIVDGGASVGFIIGAVSGFIFGIYDTWKFYNNLKKLQ